MKKTKSALWVPCVGAMVLSSLAQGHPRWSGLPDLTKLSAEEETARVSLRDLKQSELLEDFDQLTTAFRGLYGPMELKQRKLGFKYEELVAEYRAKVASAKSDAEGFGAIMQFLTRFQDGHVSLSVPMTAEGIRSYRINLFLTPVEGKALIAKVGDEYAGMGISVGDEVISIDGKAPFELLPIIRKYVSDANEITDQHLVYLALRRPFYITELKPTSNYAHLEVKKADGTVMPLDLTWRGVRFDDAVPSETFVFKRDSDRYSKRDELGSDVRDSYLEMGQTVPFFFSAKAKSKFNLSRVYPSPEFLKKYGIEDATKSPEVFAALYRYKGKTLLLIRMPTYSVSDSSGMIKAYKAVLDQYQPLADALIIDQTHNPGGANDYLFAFFKMFLKKPAANVVRRFHVDRMWVQQFKEMAKEADPALKKEDSRQFWERALEIDRASDRGETMVGPMPLAGGNLIQPDSEFTWNKPILLLADELAGSCGDLFPMLMKRNGVAKIFGERTMGLGGNVVPVLELANSGAELRLTRNLSMMYRADGKYTDEDLIENNGIQPDTRYTHTVDDFRAGFVKYIEAFSEEALKQIQ